jgi:hypothetical protein
MKQITGTTKSKINELLTAAAAFTLSAMTGSGAVFCYIVLTHAPRLNNTAGNVAAALIAIMAMAGMVLIAIVQTMANINKKGGRS